MSNTPIPTKPQAEWTAKDYQQAANHLTMELLDVKPNGPYDPAVRAMRAARDEYQRKAAALRKGHRWL